MVFADIKSSESFDEILELPTQVENKKLNLYKKL